MDIQSKKVDNFLHFFTFSKMGIWESGKFTTYLKWLFGRQKVDILEFQKKWIFSHYFGNIENKRTENIQIRASGSLVQKNQKYKLVLKVN